MRGLFLSWRRNIFSVHDRLLDDLAFLCEYFWCLPCGGFLLHVLLFGSALILTRGRGHLGRMLSFKIRGSENARQPFSDPFTCICFLFGYFGAACWGIQASVIFRSMDFSSTGSGMAYLWFVCRLILKLLLLVLCWLVFAVFVASVDGFVERSSYEKSMSCCAV